VVRFPTIWVHLFSAGGVGVFGVGDFACGYGPSRTQGCDGLFPLFRDVMIVSGVVVNFTVS